MPDGIDHSGSISAEPGHDEQHRTSARPMRRDAAGSDREV